MRKATYRVPAKDGEDAEMAVFYFKGEGGSTEANIQRWIGQFPDAKPSEVKRIAAHGRHDDANDRGSHGHVRLRNAGRFVDAEERFTVSSARSSRRRSGRTFSS